MKLETLTIRPEEAHILLNHIADANVEISLPHYRTLLLTINYRTCRATLAKEQIKSLEQLQRQLGLPPLASEAKLWDALHSAGAIQPANIQQLISEIERAGKFDPQDPRQRVIAVDTNILYNATLSNAAQKAHARPPILISRCILREISRQLSRKEKPLEKRDQNKLMQALQTPQTLKQLVSETWCTARRRATAAAREIEKLRRTYPLVYTRPRRCAGDPSIVEDYANPPIPAANITLATFDRGIVSAARVHGLKTLLLHPPPKKLEQVKQFVAQIDAPNPNELQIKLYELKVLNAQDVSRQVQMFLAGIGGNYRRGEMRPGAFAEPTTNTLVVLAPVGVAEER